MQDQPTSACVHVRAPARLHLGFLDLNGGLGRVYGSIGLAIEKPATALTIRPASTNTVKGPESDRVTAALTRFTKALDLPGHYRIEVAEAIPPHAGLGSGTQLAIAVGAGLAALEGRDRSTAALGETLERGARSAIGIAAFKAGGFILDGGRGSQPTAPPVISQMPFPSDWRVLLVLDRNATGVHGERETQAFRDLEPMPEATAGRLCRLTLMRLLPALAEKDLNAFGSAITEIQEIVGAHFAGAQGGGIWTSPDVAQIVRRMSSLGAVGIGQSSWGPTGFAFVSSQDAAESAYQSLVQDAKARGLDIMIVRGRNRGATVELTATAAEQVKEGRR